MSKPFRKILCPIDFDDHSDAALRLAGDLATAPGATVYLLHVVTEVTLDRAGPQLREQFPTIVDLAKNKLEDLARGNLDPSVHFEVLAHWGSPVKTIVGFIDDLGVDCVVMATHGRKGVRRLILGSVTEQVLRESSRPVVVIRPSLD